MLDHRPVRGGFIVRALIQAMLENGFDRGVGARADLERTSAGGLDPVAAIGARQDG